MLGLWRCHHAASSVLEMLEDRRVEKGAAALVQLCKALHQVSIDGGSWANAALPLPWEDPTERDLFGGTEAEMQMASSFNKGIRDLQSRVTAARAEHGKGNQVQEEGDETGAPRGPRKSKKELAATAKAAAAKAKADATAGQG